LRGRQAVYYVGDDRDAALQRTDLARQIAALVPGFEAVTYPSWDALLARWWRDAPAGAVLALDEVPALVASAPELPSLLQKHVDAPEQAIRHTLVCGSSQRMMMGLVLDASAPLYGRAQEIIRLEPMEPRWLREALGLRRAEDVVQHYAVWGGVPRYWELAADHDELWAAVEQLVLDPLGVLHHEPSRLLLDDLREVTRASSILAVIGRGCHRLSEIAGRLELPATSLSHPLNRLMELGLVVRELPFGTPKRSGKKTLYRIADPFLRFWYRFVDPNRSRLAAREVRAVVRQVQQGFPLHLGPCWEELARSGVARLRIDDHDWLVGERWWGREAELDIVAASASDPDRVLVGEAKLGCTGNDEARQLLKALRQRVARCPPLEGKRITTVLFVLSWRGSTRPEDVFTAADVVGGGR
jgi:AAA+ ATPase superfamily predicted ATPase